MRFSCLTVGDVMDDDEEAEEEEEVLLCEQLQLQTAEAGRIASAAASSRMVDWQQHVLSLPQVLMVFFVVVSSSLDVVEERSERGSISRTATTSSEEIAFFLTSDMSMSEAASDV